MRCEFLSLTFVTLTVIDSARAQIKPYITTAAEYWTECKTCPRSLCPNQLYYGLDDSFNATCWTRGTKIMGDRLWLKSQAGCYVTQYDVLEYEGDCMNDICIACSCANQSLDTTDLAYCGQESEQQSLTIEDATLKYKTECRICPGVNCYTAAYLKEDTDVELTCWYPDGQVIIDDP